MDFSVGSLVKYYKGNNIKFDEVLQKFDGKISVQVDNDIELHFFILLSSHNIPIEILEDLDFLIKDSNPPFSIPVQYHEISYGDDIVMEIVRLNNGHTVKSSLLSKSLEVFNFSYDVTSRLNLNSFEDLRKVKRK